MHDGFRVGAAPWLRLQYRRNGAAYFFRSPVSVWGQPTATLSCSTRRLRPPKVH